jgi:EpsG family
MMNILEVDKNLLQILAYIVLTVAGLYFIGMRGVDIGSDTPAYYLYFDFVKYGDSFEGAERIEIGFYWLTKIISYFTDSKNVYLSTIFLIQFIGITSALYKKSEIFRPYLLATLIWLSYPFFYSITFNVVRQGLAFVFVIYAIDAKLQNKKYSPYILLLLGTLFHYATLFYIICFIALELKPKFLTLLWFWFFAVVLAFLGWMEGIIYSLLRLVIGNNPYFSGYLDSSINADYMTGFRIDFVIFSALPIAYYFLIKKYISENVDGNPFVFTLYLAMNIIYLCFASFPYSDRFALASWLLIPLMIDFSFLRNIRMLRVFKEVIICSSIMVFSYYLFFFSS